MSMDAWLTDSNDALNITMVRADEDTRALSAKDAEATIEFNPAFTYPIFGEQEKIFGYKGLDIQLKFASGSLKQYLQIDYSNQLKSEATPADDIEGTLYKFIPADYTKSEEAFEQTVEDDATAFKPLGTRLGAYAPAKGKGKGKAKAKGANVTEEVTDEDEVAFEFYHSTWSTPGFREYHRRMQLFILLFIEGGSYIQEDEDAWEFVTLYERRKRPSCEFTYHFIGYTSCYPFWHYPDQIRLRLSQFVILPPYQHQGHGSKLYSALYKMCLSRPDVAELTVEDPAEAFEDLRDRNDLRYLVQQGVPDDESFLVDVGSDTKGQRAQWEEGVRTKHKLAQRQFDRLLEMLLLRQLKRSDQAAVRAYRLHVKARLYRFNYEMLCQMTTEERKEALAKTYESVVEDYDRILEMTFG